MTDTTVPLETGLVPTHVFDAASEFEELHRRYWRARGIVLDWVKANGPIRLEDGSKVGFLPDGNDWLAEEIRTVMPVLIKAAKVTFEGSIENVERIASIAAEDLPDLKIAEMGLTVDKTEANRVLRAGGEAAAKIAPFRVQRNKLGVSR